jgi:hypothetical protein
VEGTAISRLEDTLRWRREFGVYSTLTPQHVEPEVSFTIAYFHMSLIAEIRQGVTGKEIIFGYDTEGRPGVYLVRLSNLFQTQEHA